MGDDILYSEAMLDSFEATFTKRKLSRQLVKNNQQYIKVNV